MRFREIIEAAGRITQQNQTADVGPQEIKTQAAKFGNTVDKDGKPPTLSKKTKGSKTNVLHNLGLTESILYELNIPRNQMPQISMEDLENEYNLEKGTVDPATLETSQDQRIPGMVDKTVQSIKDGFNKPLVIDKNGFIVNGHHRYDAYLKLEMKKVPVIRVTDASIQELVKNFSHTAKDTYAEDEVVEKWSKKYKSSINCNNPKGFSQKAHCAGKKKNENREIGIHTSSKDFAVIDLSKSADGTFWMNGVDNTNWDTTITTGQGVDMAFEISPQAKLATYDDIDKYSTGQLEDMGYDGVRMVDSDGVTYQIWNTDVLTRTDLEENFAGGIGFKHKDHKFERTAKNIKQKIDQPIEESFDTAADWTYGPGSEGSAVYAAKVDNAYIEITYKPTVNTENGVIISFTRDGDAGVTGKGSENKVFGAVINHIKHWVDIREPKVVIFTARKPADENGATDDSRSQLYKRMVQRFASQAGYDYDVDSASKEDTFYLEKQNNSDVEENFADGKKKGKSRPGRFKKAGVSCSGSVTSLRKKAKNSSGEKQKGYHFCANMKSGKK